MRSAVLLTVVLAGRAPAQRPGVIEFGAGGLATFASSDFAGAALSVARRSGQGRVAAVIAGGGTGEGAALRAEATAQFVLNAGARRGVTLYGAAGVAYLGARGSRGRGYLTLFLGVEGAAARPRGWFLEAGFGGGARVALGLRWRRPA
ncbi:MAG TPA: hypothetical protein VNI61_07660 [Gemmatimonadales bacterium]|nr:hypothetical protein [Gemmatimonadales bacterium]